MCHRPIIPRIERYLRETGIAATLFGRLVAGDPRLVSDLRHGRTPGARLSARIECQMNKQLTATQANQLWNISRSKKGAQS
jgi:hypothetical protein